MELNDLTVRVAELRGRVRATELFYVRIDGHDVSLGRRAARHGSDASEVLTVRTWLDEGRFGTASGEPDAFEDLVLAALAQAEVAAPDPHEGPAAPRDQDLGGLGIFDRRWDTLSDSHREDVLRSARSSLQEAPRLEPGTLNYRDERAIRRFASSRGVALEEASTRFVVEGSATAASPDGAIHLSERIASRRFSSVATLPLGEFVARRAASIRQPGETLPFGPVRVVLTPRATAQLFGRLGEAFTAARASRDEFFLAKPGIALDPRLHLIDDGLLAGGFHTRAFDDRGVVPLALTLLRDGRPDGRFVSIAESRRHDVRPTGHQWGDRLGPSNLVLKSGTRTVNALLAELRGPSLRVDDLPDLDEGLDLLTGGARLTVHGEVMDANRAVGAMRHVVIEGSLQTVLGELVEVCSDTDRWGAVDAPALITQGWTMSSRA